MIEKFVADKEYAGSFVGYDIAAIRGSAGELDKEIDVLFDALLNGNGEAPPNEDIQAAIDRIRAEHGDKAADFYEAAYGCALTERMERSLIVDTIFGRTAE